MLAAITFLFCVFLSRFLYVQLIWRQELISRAIDEWTREIPISPQRGKITDRNGEVLAGNQTAYSVYARANAIKDPETCAHVLSALLDKSYEETYSLLTDKHKSEITLLKQGEKSVAQKIEGTNLSGVYYARDNKRVYPFGALASQILGFTALGSEGTSGIEKYYDGFLAGKKGEILYETDLVGVEIEGKTPSYLPATDGMNVSLTLDYRLQAKAEEVMARVLEESKAKGARCIVLDPNDFSILAMVNLPSFDLNSPPRTQIELLNDLSRNRVLSDIYEPGSTFKIVTAASNIEETLKGNKNALPLNHIYPSSRTRSVDGTTIKCWSDHANGKHSNQTLKEALYNSCNPCFVDIALSLGKETFYDYLKAFHFGTATGIDFSGEALGMLLPESTLRDCDLARIGFGQTIAVSPLQLACAAASAVNGGYYFEPHLLREVYADDGYVYTKYEKKLLSRTVSEEASQILSEMLEGVVSEGSGKKAYIEGFHVAGKTGTAQKYENGHIAQGKYVSSFLGYFPAQKPQYLALVIIDEPQGTYYGSALAAPCAKEIFEGIIKIMHLEPSS